MQHQRRDLALTFLVLAIFAFLARTLFFGGSSSDLAAIWLAATEFGNGNLGGIYPADSNYFTMQAPEGWLVLARSLGHEGPVFPYIYPPLWAALMSKPVAITDYANFRLTVSVLNAALVVGIVYFAYQTSRPRMPIWGFFAASLLALSITSPGLSAMHENQPQILVSFLLVFTLERTQRGAYATAGCILAVAAALKVFPALFAVIWIANRQWQALAGFALTGSVLAGISVFLAGWPLHIAFIEQLSEISRTVLVSSNSYNLNAAIAEMFFSDQLIHIDASGHPTVLDTGNVGWRILPRASFWQVVSSAILLLAMIWAAGRIRRRPKQEFTMWVFAIGVLALLGPISWPYYYIPLVAFIPIIAERYGRMTGLTIVFVALVPSTLLFPGIIQSVFGDAISATLLRTIGLAILTISYGVLPASDSGTKASQ